jgi:SAM-dependent methyltransferase
MSPSAYDGLAEVYDWLVPDELVEPSGAVAAFETVLDLVPSGGRVLDCACGTGQLAVGAALRGYAVAASDASEQMVASTHELAARHGASLATAVCAWESMPAPGLAGPFHAVFCVGNSITHAAGAARRRAALTAMARVLAPDGVLAVTSRTWERVRQAGDRLEIGDRIVTRHGRGGLVVRAWRLGAGWDDAHTMEVAVAVPNPDGTVATITERLSFWPFSHDELREDLQAAGVETVLDTFSPDADRYLVLARRAEKGS